MDSDETIHIGGLHRLAFDRRPPASRRVRQATGEGVDPQPFHQRVRIDHAERLGIPLPEGETSDGS